MFLKMACWFDMILCHRWLWSFQQTCACGFGGHSPRLHQLQKERPWRVLPPTHLWQPDGDGAVRVWKRLQHPRPRLPHRCGLGQSQQLLHQGPQDRAHRLQGGNHRCKWLSLYIYANDAEKVAQSSFCVTSSFSLFFLGLHSIIDDCSHIAACTLASQKGFHLSFVLC